jgi:hypothetical protein
MSVCAIIVTGHAIIVTLFHDFFFDVTIPTALPYLGWEFRFGIPFPGTTGIRNSASDFGVPELSGGKANWKT